MGPWLFKGTHYRHTPELEGSNLYQQQELSSPKFTRVQISCMNMSFQLHDLISISRALSRGLILHSAWSWILLKKIQSTFILTFITSTNAQILHLTLLHSIILHLPFVVANSTSLGLFSGNRANCQRKTWNKAWVKNSFTLQKSHGHVNHFLAGIWSSWVY